MLLPHRRMQRSRHRQPRAQQIPKSSLPSTTRRHMCLLASLSLGSSGNAKSSPLPTPYPYTKNSLKLVGQEITNESQNCVFLQRPASGTMILSISKLPVKCGSIPAFLLRHASTTTWAQRYLVSRNIRVRRRLSCVGPSVACQDNFF